MNRIFGWAAVAAAGAAVGAVTARAATDTPDRAAIETVIHDYILAHPEIIPEAMERLQANAAAKAIGAERQALTTPFGGAWAGNPRGDVTLVMFTDYSCGYCRASAPDIERLLADDPKLKVVWREIPVLGPQSEAAAHVALAAARQGTAYPAFHRALFAGGRPDKARLGEVARGLHLDQAQLARDAQSAEVTQEIDRNLALAGKLGISGTPAFVIGDKLYGGAIGHDALVQAIAAARKG
jgi:protein-disulfide isomerase